MFRLESSKGARALAENHPTLRSGAGDGRERAPTVRRKSFTIAENGENKPMTADDQVAVTGLLKDGTAFSIHYRGGVSRGSNLLWEINGTQGDLQLSAAGGHAQIFEMTVTWREGRAVLARSPARTRPISVVAAASLGLFHQRRPGVRAFRSGLSRGNAFLPHVRRRGHTSSHAERD